MLKSKDSFNVRKNKADAIFGVAKDRPQCNVSFLKDRRKELYPLESVPHQNPDDVKLWQLTDRHLTPFEIDVKQIREAPSFISCIDEFDSMMSEIQNEACLGFDLEGHMQFSFGNMISLMQISTIKKDFLVDPFKLFNEIKTKLKKKLEDPGTLIIVHGGANDLIWLKGEMKIFPLGVFDTQVYEMLRTGEKQGISFDAFKIKYFTSCVDHKPRIDKSICQVADWRLRPLPKEMKIYGSEDSSYVLLGWNEILKQGDFATIRQTLNATKNLLLKPWEPPKFSYEPQLKKLKCRTSLNPEEFRKFDLLWRFQVYLGLLLDQNPVAFFPVKSLLGIVTKKPIDRISLRWCVGGRIPRTIPWKGEYSYLRLMKNGEEAFTAFKKLRCNICRKQSHPAWACAETQTSQTRKQNSLEFDTKEQKAHQNRRRHQNAKRNKLKNQNQERGLPKE